MTDITRKIILYRSILSQLISKETAADLNELALGTKPFLFLKDLPTKQDMKEQEELAESLAYGTLGLLYLRPVSYRMEYDGAVVHDIMPRPGKEEEASSSGRAPLPLHTDMAFLRFPLEVEHPFRAAAPDFLILSGVVNLSHVRTRVVTLKEALDELSDDDIKALGDPEFNIESPATVRPKRVAEGVPVLYDHSSFNLMLRFNNAGRKIVGTTPKAQAALESLASVFQNDKLGVEIDIQPGTVFVFNNRQVVHGRGKITQEQKVANAKDRHFKRIYGQRIETETNPLFPKNPFMQAL